MSEMLASSVMLDNMGVLQTELPIDLFNNLKKSIDTLPEDAAKFNKNLLGHMDEEYSLNHDKENIAEYLEALAHTYTQANPGYIEMFEEVSKANYYKLYLDSLWVNKQKKYEFNPVHHHNGALSFVIWVKIPYNLEDEEKYFPQTSISSQEGSGSYTSKFSFVYTDMLGRIRHTPLPIDKTWEGRIIMFPAALHHCVYPFYTSDDYRISVSGNIRIRIIE